MKKVLENEKLERNFSLYEFIEGTQIGKNGAELNWKYINSLKEPALKKLIANIKKIAKELQFVRNLVNTEFKTEIGIEITSGFRCLEYEKLKGRTGESQHTQGHCADFRVVCESDDIYNDAMRSIFKYYRDKDFIGGLAKKISNLPAHSNRQMRFIHIDFRGSIARWTY